MFYNSVINLLGHFIKKKGERENYTTVFLVTLHVGGKSSGIFGEPDAPAHTQRTMPPGGPASNIFGAAESAPVQSPSRSHPNKQKVGHALKCYPTNLSSMPYLQCIMQ